MTTVFLISKFFVDGLRNKVGSILCSIQLVYFHKNASPTLIVTFFILR